VYKVNEIFYSLQGEGFWTGTPMVFLRLSGCNLKCPFCDTDHAGFREMSEEEIVAEAKAAGGACERMCVTGGEPALQLDRELVDALHGAGYRIHVETNGTRALPEGVDWVTLSPKTYVPGLKGDGTVVLEKADEVKVVCAGSVDEKWVGFPADWHFLQPCDTGNPERNKAILAQTMDHIQRHPRWRLSLQTHKLLNIK
jgi:organic radical activating enzyme